MEPRLSGAQRQTLVRALLDAFPEHDDLEAMVSFQLNENLDAIAGGQTLNALVLNLIQWAEAEGRLDDLIAGAHAANPGNAAIQGVVADWAATKARAAAAEGPRVLPLAGALGAPAWAGLAAIPVLLVLAWLVFFPPWRSSRSGTAPTPTSLPATATSLPATATLPPPTATPATQAAILPATLTPAPVVADCSGAQACFTAGNQYMATGDWHRAIVEFNRAIADDPAFADAYDSLGYAYDRTGDYDRAIQLYGQAISLDAQNPLFYYNRGSTYYRIALVRDVANPTRQAIDYTNVRDDMTKALSLGLAQQQPYAYFFRGSALASLGDPGQARADLQQAQTTCAVVDPGLCKEVNAALTAVPGP